MRKGKKKHDDEPTGDGRVDGPLDRDWQAGDSDDETAPQDSVSDLQRERDGLEDKLKRALADIANMRRRQSEDLRRASDGAVGRVAQELLPIMDSFELALSAEGDREQLLEGVHMVHSMLEDLLGRHGVEPIQAEGKPFDPLLHEALAVEQREDVDPGTVVKVHQTGFRIGDRVLRPARVVVSQAPAAEDEHDGAEDAEIPRDSDSQSES